MARAAFLAAFWSALFFLLCFGRFLIGFGLETTFIASPECYRRAFPGKMGIMSGVDTAQRMMWVFLSYQLLPIMANSKTESLDEGTNFALMICFFLSVASTLAGIAVTAGFFLEDKREKKSLEDNSDEGVIKRTFGSLARGESSNACSSVGPCQVQAPDIYLPDCGGNQKHWLLLQHLCVV